MTPNTYIDARNINKYIPMRYGNMDLIIHDFLIHDVSFKTNTRQVQ